MAVMDRVDLRLVALLGENLDGGTPRGCRSGTDMPSALAPSQAARTGYPTADGSFWVNRLRLRSMRNASRRGRRCRNANDLGEFCSATPTAPAGTPALEQRASNIRS